MEAWKILKAQDEKLCPLPESPQTRSVAASLTGQGGLEKRTARSQNGQQRLRQQIAKAVPLEGVRVVDLGDGRQILVVSSEAPSRRAGNVWAAPREAAASVVQPAEAPPFVLAPVERGPGSDADGGTTSLQETSGLVRVLTVDDMPALEYKAPAVRSWSGSERKPLVLVDALERGDHRGELSEELAMAKEELSQREAGKGSAAYKRFCVENWANNSLSMKAKSTRLTPKERNRLAQKRFRDRQKALIAGLQSRNDELNAVLRHYQARTADLEGERLEMLAEFRRRGMSWPIHQ